MHTLVTSWHYFGSFKKISYLLDGEIRDANGLTQTFLNKLLHGLEINMKLKKKPNHLSQVFNNLWSPFYHILTTFRLFIIYLKNSVNFGSECKKRFVLDRPENFEINGNDGCPKFPNEICWPFATLHRHLGFFEKMLNGQSDRNMPSCIFAFRLHKPFTKWFQSRKL